MSVNLKRNILHSISLFGPLCNGFSGTTVSSQDVDAFMCTNSAVHIEANCIGLFPDI
jgi:hypothetical protein